MGYHLSQWKEPKRSTIHFERFAKDVLSGQGAVLDIGCGAGAATAYLASRSPTRTFFGADISQDLIGIAKELATRTGALNLSFGTADVFNLAPSAEFDGVVCLQTLSWLPDFDRPLKEIFQKISPSWIALSSLFYEGDISCRIEVTEHKRNRSTFYNVYAIPALQRFCVEFGYEVTCVEPFVIDVDLPRPMDRDLMSTYTIREGTGGQSDAARVQISGPLLMNWHFVLIRRSGTDF